MNLTGTRRLRNFTLRPLTRAAATACLLASLAAEAAWQQEPGALAWVEGANVTWRFNYNTSDGKPFFHPLSTGGKAALTAARPDDHPWHYGLWFSWKYINEVNYWEQDRKTGLSEGKTRWSTPVLQTREDGSAKIEMDLEYIHPSGRIELTEHRVLVISAPTAEGAYTIDWDATFIAGPEGAKLDRTPMLGEPNGQVNGGYAGLSLRMAAAPVTISLLSEQAPVADFASNRARPDSRALASNYSVDGEAIGAIAILSDPANVQGSSPWYVLFSDQMRFYCSAILAPKPLQLVAGDTLGLRYRILVRPTAWTSESLQTALAGWKPQH